MRGATCPTRAAGLVSRSWLSVAPLTHGGDAHDDWLVGEYARAVTAIDHDDADGGVSGNGRLPAHRPIIGSRRRLRKRPVGHRPGPRSPYTMGCSPVLRTRRRAAGPRQAAVGAATGGQQLDALVRLLADRHPPA